MEHGPNDLPGQAYSPNDTDTTPHKCLKGEATNEDGPCVPCPGTAGSDCSRCDNGNAPSYAPPCPGCMGNRHDIAIRDVVKVPAHLAPGKYVLGPCRSAHPSASPSLVSCRTVPRVAHDDGMDPLCRVR